MKHRLIGFNDHGVLKFRVLQNGSWNFLTLMEMVDWMENRKLSSSFGELKRACDAKVIELTSILADSENKSNGVEA